MEIIYINITSVMDALYSALRTVANWLITHGISSHGVYVSFFELFCGVLVASVLFSFIVYDDNDSDSNTDD